MPAEDHADLCGFAVLTLLRTIFLPVPALIAEIAAIITATVSSSMPLSTTGAGAASRHSVGMTVFGGMIAVAFVGTFLVPAFYVMIEEFKIRTAKYIKEKRAKK